MTDTRMTLEGNRRSRSTQLRRIGGLALAVSVLAFGVPGRASATLVTACTTVDICYCINTDYRDAIAANIARVRQLIVDNKAQGKAIGYLSVPLSPAGGGYSPVNAEVATRTAKYIEMRLGKRSVWVLNPGAEGSDKMKGASGADYMYMWTTILEGRNGFGEDFDFFYFVSPSDFSKYFALTGQGDLDKLEDYFDAQVALDPNFKKAADQGDISRSGFRNYYGLRASVAFSLGSHDEWNIARLLNERRRGITDLGIAYQLAIFFDGRPVTPGDFENAAASGDVGRCNARFPRCDIA
jgi:hypothetical protein